ncbi:riboflavin synthase [Leptospira sp. 2 VSF19]|uniref:Riboflavin synthase n=1 Tax=Leptospira soteropolitanensis TaxID=2950025 RepID=A0AAW5VD45_9LEPT|nr:riboflavin synthase [Leptospira soteropolitanensis]MCW7492853.1 riboflavin synthase [Leptospira soteropolitanensis]MCW7500088.1 riboflavin synthase [Leptospira soteropolitanensis]MCW7522339.1 riboflavin synthase [Leptospira soteropolitanensis]MCW7526195.1 riboflavin synthase [Leptospira soteropolitanensis]MCW7529693.1 riboflavin synthase [Leptospira soteropolitanensis]
MFTGLVETLGKVITIEPIDSGIQFTIETEWENPDLKIGDSIAINGACMTVTEFSDLGNLFKFYASFKSLELTNLSRLGEGSTVNLERAMALGQRFGGHMVQGHVDGMAKVISRKKIETEVEEFWVEIPKELQRYFVKKGSVTLDGISLTVVDVKDGNIQLILIPETMEKTNANTWKKDQRLNVEVDVLAKYIENYLEQRSGS